MGYDKKVWQQGMTTSTSLLLVFLLEYYVMHFGPVAFVYQINKSWKKKPLESEVIVKSV